MPTYIVITDPEVAPEAPLTTSLLTRLRDNALSYLGAPSGTKLLFPQASAPLGWTKDTTHNDKVLRVMNTAGGTSGGSSPFSTVFGKTATDPVTLSTGHLPAYTPTGSVSSSTPTQTDPAAFFGLVGGGVAATAFLANNFGASGSGGVGSAGSGSNGAVASVFTGAAQGGASAPFVAGMDIRVQHVDTLIATKD